MSISKITHTYAFRGAHGIPTYLIAAAGAILFPQIEGGNRLYILIRYSGTAHDAGRQLAVIIDCGYGAAGVKMRLCKYTMESLVRLVESVWQRFVAREQG